MADSDNDSVRPRLSTKIPNSSPDIQNRKLRSNTQPKSKQLNFIFSDLLFQKPDQINNSYSFPLLDAIYITSEAAIKCTQIFLHKISRDFTFKQTTSNQIVNADSLLRSFISNETIVSAIQQLVTFTTHKMKRNQFRVLNFNTYEIRLSKDLENYLAKSMKKKNELDWSIACLKKKYETSNWSESSVCLPRNWKKWEIHLFKTCLSELDLFSESKRRVLWGEELESGGGTGQERHCVCKWFFFLVFHTDYTNTDHAHFKPRRLNFMLEGFSY